MASTPSKTENRPAGGLLPRVLVVVLGDLGHSPRMQNHARELADAGYHVDFLGYAESELPADTSQSSRINVISLPSCRFVVTGLPTALSKLVSFLIRLVVQTLVLLWIGLFRVERPRFIVIQSPPVLPTVPVAFLLARLRGAKLIVDWHNIGYTVLAQTVKWPAIIAMAKAIELLMCRAADINFVVSASQRQWMQINAGVMAITLYDRPVPSRFRPLGGSERKEARRSIRERLGWDPAEDVPLLVSSTSWTPDEDFGMLVAALQETQVGGKRLQLLVTGKGPLRTHYEERIIGLGLRNVQFATVWLSFGDYARLLGSADLGLCLHSSSSGVDLPMKAIDMIAAGLPLAAVRFPAIEELLEDGKSGFLVEDASGLATIIGDAANRRLRPVKAPELETWHDQWKRLVEPLLT